jgi:hypothetical protein
MSRRKIKGEFAEDGSAKVADKHVELVLLSSLELARPNDWPLTLDSLVHRPR